MPDKLKVGDDMMSWGITAKRAVELGEDAEYPRSDAAIFHFEKLTQAEQDDIIRRKRLELGDAIKDKKNLNVAARESAAISRKLHLRPGELSPYPYRKKQANERIANLTSSIESLLIRRDKSRKLPWQMTNAEFVDAKGAGANYDWYKQFGWAEGHHYNFNPNYKKLTGHHVIVKSALSKGLPVPACVIREYPDLAGEPNVDAAENAAIHAYYAANPCKDKLNKHNKAKCRVKRTHKPSSTLGRMR